MTFWANLLVKSVFSSMAFCCSAKPDHLSWMQNFSKGFKSSGHDIPNFGRVVSQAFGFKGLVCCRRKCRVDARVLGSLRRLVFTDSTSPVC